MSVSYLLISALFFINNLDFIASRYLIKKLAKTFGQVAIIILNWEKSNTVIYNIAKTEANFFSKSYCQQLNKQIAIIQIKINSKKIKFNKKAIC